MTTWTGHKAGWAIMGPDGRFLTGRGLCWEPEGAALFTSRAKARDLLQRLPAGCRVVQLVSVAEWDQQYGPQAVPMAEVQAAEKAKRRARDARRRAAVA
jgi:hypothetical protein